MNKLLSTAVLVGMGVLGEPDALAATPPKSPYGVTTQYVEDANKDPLTPDNVLNRCSGASKLTPAVLREEVDVFNQGLLAAGTVTSDERKKYIQGQAKEYIDAKSEEINLSLTAVKLALQYYENTSVVRMYPRNEEDGPRDQYERPFQLSDYSADTPKSLLELVSKQLGKVEDMVEEIDTAIITTDDKAIFEKSIEAPLDALRQVGINCNAAKVGPLSLYPDRDLMVKKDVLPQKERPATYTRPATPKEFEIDKFAQEQALRLEALSEKASHSTANFQKKYGISAPKDSAQ